MYFSAGRPLKSIFDAVRWVVGGCNPVQSEMLIQELSFSTSHMYCVHLQAAVNLSGAQTPLQGNISSEMF